MKVFQPLVCMALLLPLGINAQISRSNSKKSIAYRAGYQRITSSSSSNHNLEIKDGTLWAWGYNFNGQLGDATYINRPAPVKIGTGTTWVSVSTGASFSVGLMADGTLWAWGYNAYGQLGDGSNVDKIVPVQVGADNKWVSVVAGYEHCL